VSSLGIKQIDLLPFNELPGAKYKEIGRGEWEYLKLKRQNEDYLNKLAKQVKAIGLKVTIGGLW